MPHTKSTAFKIVGDIDKQTIEYLNRRFGDTNVTVQHDVVDIVESDWFKSMAKKVTPGDTVRIYRENLNLTQRELAEKAGLKKSSYISDIENGRRPVSKRLIKAFSEIFGISPELLIG